MCNFIITSLLETIAYECRATLLWKFFENANNEVEVAFGGENPFRPGLIVTNIAIAFVRIGSVDAGAFRTTGFPLHVGCDVTRGYKKKRRSIVGMANISILPWLDKCLLSGILRLGIRTQTHFKEAKQAGFISAKNRLDPGSARCGQFDDIVTGHCSACRPIDTRRERLKA